MQVFCWKPNCHLSYRHLARNESLIADLIIHANVIQKNCQTHSFPTSNFGSIFPWAWAFSELLNFTTFCLPFWSRQKIVKARSSENGEAREKMNPKFGTRQCQNWLKLLQKLSIFNFRPPAFVSTFLRARSVKRHSVKRHSVNCFWTPNPWRCLVAFHSFLVLLNVKAYNR